MSIPDIISLQRGLLDAGFDPGPIDGLMGPKTISASARYMLEEHADHLVAQRALNRLQPNKSTNYINGIDVSAYNGKIDWKAVKNAGIEFAIVKCSEGTTHKNRYRQENLDGARAWGVAVGGYHFARPDTYQRLKLEDARNEAENFLDCYGAVPQPGDLTPALDLESGLIKTRHSYNCDWILEWCRVIEEAVGKKPILYTARWAVTSRLINADPVQLAMLSKYPLWWAEYRPETALVPTKSIFPWQDWTVWQWGSKGKVDGVKGNVDVNRMRAEALEGLRI